MNLVRKLSRVVAEKLGEYVDNVDPELLQVRNEKNLKGNVGCLVSRSTTYEYTAKSVLLLPVRRVMGGIG